MTQEYQQYQDYMEHDTLTQEYQEYQDYMEHENRLYTMRKKMVNVAHGDADDFNELRQLMAE